MPKRRTAKDEARYYTNSRQRRAQSLPATADEQIKDVSTRLRELRFEQAKANERLHPSRQAFDPLPIVVSPLGLTPANYTAAPYADPLAGPQASVPRTSRLIPGPAPPRSWFGPERKARFQQPHRFRSRNYPDTPFPDIDMPNQKTLVYSSLLTLATHFFEHQESNKYNLPQLGIHLKQWLLLYIATRNIAGAVTKEGLDVLFPRMAKDNDPDEMKQIVALSRKDEKELRCLDLTDALAGNISIGQLRTFLLPTPSCEEWQEEHRFPNLTHLSLETSSLHSVKIDHLKLVHVLSQQCPRLTHLNLAGVLPPGSGSSLYQLSKTLVCLEYIDLSRNPDVLNGHIDTGERGGEASYWDDTGPEPTNPRRNERTRTGGRRVTSATIDGRPPAGGTGYWSQVLDALNWEGGWRLVKVLVAKKCGFTVESERAIQANIFAKRGERGWIQVVLT